jgi:cytoskeletal protein CcmA (bactofilin family)
VRAAARYAASVALTVGALIALAAGPAQARSSVNNDHNSQIVINGRLDVPAGQTASTAVLFNGTANIAGTLTGALVVFNGDVTISGTVRKDVVVFNGAVDVRSGATVGGDIVSREQPTIANDATVLGDVRGVSGTYDLAAFGWWSRFAWWLGYTVSTLILGLLMLALVPRADAGIGRAGERLGAAFGFGALLFFVLPIAAVVLMAIVVGIPLGLFLLLALALIYTVGYVVAAHALGRRLIRSTRSRFVAFFVGWAILRVIALVPVLGGLSWIVASLFGLGVLLLLARERGRVVTIPDRSDAPVATSA